MDKKPIFTKQHLISSIVLVVCLIGMNAFVYYAPRWIKNPDEDSFVLLPEHAVRFDSIVDARRDSVYRARYGNRYAYKSALPPLARRRFDPNSADSFTLLQQGFAPWQVSSMMKYRRKNGRYRTKEDVQRIPGMTDSLYAQLEKYIAIEAPEEPFVEPKKLQEPQERAEVFPKKIKKDTIIELNSADTATLQFIRGVGSATAKKIIAYRNRLGGFYAVEQLREIKDIAPNTLNEISTHFTVDTTLITPLYLYRASQEKLTRHPYISYKQAERLYYYRRMKIKCKTLHELPDIQQDNLFNDSILNKLRPYIKLE